MCPLSTKKSCVKGIAAPTLFVCARGDLTEAAGGHLQTHVVQLGAGLDVVGVHLAAPAGVAVHDRCHRQRHGREQQPNVLVKVRLESRV